MVDWVVNLESPRWLVLLPLALLPWWGSPLRPAPSAWLALLPVDAWSRSIRIALPLLGSLSILSGVIALAGPFIPQQTIERIGRGAHLVLLLDRSRSMDDTFAGRAPSGDEESKGQAAARLLRDFLEERPHDWVGVAGFSTGSLYMGPLTAEREPNYAAIATAALPGLGYTHVAEGLARALSYFENQPLSGSRAIVFVSDGAAVIEPKIQNELRIAFKRHHIRLYWIFLRSADSPGIHDQPEDPTQDNPHARPEYYLHRYFQSLGVPYRAFEAESAGGLRRAIDTIERLEKHPFHYLEKRPRRKLATPFYWLALIGVALLLIAKGSEAR
ncbi:MAG: hypothetical protein Kow0060_15490 [Methylohalobius crimeensis]